MIFFARINNEIVGTCSAIKVNDDVFELAKMAVTEKAQGKQAGKKLALVVIGYAISQKAKTVILETASKLTAAISLYEKLGFIYVPFDHPSKYTRTTFKMKLNL
jgi:ribosomal protein S18 acetylase RimI-like enzyme